jgi:hypothetical protein
VQEKVYETIKGSRPSSPPNEPSFGVDLTNKMRVEQPVVENKNVEDIK